MKIEHRGVQQPNTLFNQETEFLIIYSQSRKAGIALDWVIDSFFSLSFQYRMNTAHHKL
jgi:hypothetical protein